MELKHLKHFMMLANLKNFSQAAMKLNIAQPSLSRSIQKMEELLGIKLLERTAKRFELTQYGKLVYKHGENILGHVDYLKDEIHLMRGIEAGKLIIGASPIPSNSLIGPTVGCFIRDHPRISVELKVENWKKLNEALLKGGLTLFIAETQATLLDESDEHETIPLPKSAAIFCCRPEHPLMRENNVYLPSLRDYPLAVPQAMPNSVSQKFEDLFDDDRHDFSGLIRFDQFQPIKASLLNCDMLVITPEVSVKKELAEGSLVALPIKNMPEVSASFSVVYLKNRRLSAMAELFIKFLVIRCENELLSGGIKGLHNEDQRLGASRGVPLLLAQVP
ncbi:LysR family transcriptional regulator [Shewanella sp.]|uniref:LysR family transcriptional regulator n=1 Tax=Shewanella sp. TaxID=50422 RepID=UPI00258CCF5E|nr:LysR family transcriptional regulator [Shewanella sp.]MCJ8305024.1 LysR family transcriptional regulator [Shewanella sp.]